MTRSAKSDEFGIVADAVEELAITVVGPPIALDPQLIWWRAQLMGRLEAERRALKPVDLGSSITVSIVSFAGVAVAVWFWRDLPATGILPAGIAALALTGVGLAEALTAYRLRSSA